MGDSLRDALRAGLGHPPIDAARTLAALGPPAAIAELAIDPDIPPHQRVVALLAVAIALADDPSASCPAAAIDAVEDPETAAAAIDRGLGAALTGVLRAAPREGLRATRVLVGRLLLAAGEVGPHVVELLVAGGDRTRAAAAAAADLAAHLAARVPSEALWGRLQLVVEWSRDAELVTEIVRAIGDARTLDALLYWLERLPTNDPAAVSRARAVIGWARGLGNRSRS